MAYLRWGECCPLYAYWTDGDGDAGVLECSHARLSNVTIRITKDDAEAWLAGGDDLGLADWTELERLMLRDVLAFWLWDIGDDKSVDPPPCPDRYVEEFARMKAWDKAACERVAQLGKSDAALDPVAAVIDALAKLSEEDRCVAISCAVDRWGWVRDQVEIDYNAPVGERQIGREQARATTMTKAAVAYGRDCADAGRLAQVIAHSSSSDCDAHAWRALMRSSRRTISARYSATFRFRSMRSIC